MRIFPCALAAWPSGIISSGEYTDLEIEFGQCIGILAQEPILRIHIVFAGKFQVKFRRNSYSKKYEGKLGIEKSFI
jgi:hypothetical protein